MSTAVGYIGGQFELDPLLFARPQRLDPDSFFRLTANHLRVAAGRTAFEIALQDLDLGEAPILVPDYICGASLLPVLERRARPYDFYPVGASLEIDAEAVASQVAASGAGAVLLINYFGLIDQEPLARRLRSESPDLRILLDEVQALYDLRARPDALDWADYRFVSFRKFLPLPDGGILLSRRSLQADLGPPNGERIGGQLVAAVLRDAFLEGHCDGLDAAAVESTYLELFAAADAQDPGAAGMSALASALLQRLPLADFAQRRRENYRHLNERLHDVEGVAPLFQALPETAVPLALPVVVAAGQRDALRASLRDRGIYCPVHWPLGGRLLQEASPDCRARAESLLSLPVDQRYGPSELDRMLAAIRDFAA